MISTYDILNSALAYSELINIATVYPGTQHMERARHDRSTHDFIASGCPQLHKYIGMWCLTITVNVSSISDLFVELDNDDRKMLSLNERQHDLAYFIKTLHGDYTALFNLVQINLYNWQCAYIKETTYYPLNF